MHIVNQKRNRLLSLVIGFLLIASMLFYNTTSVAQSPTLPQPGQQLAYFVGYHGGGYHGYHRNYGGYHNHYYHGYVRPTYRNNYIYFGYGRPYQAPYWTNWMYTGHGCKKSCLVNSRSGQVIRCRQVCY